MDIQLNKLTKSFKSYKKEEGLMGSIKSLYKRDYTLKYAVKEFDLEIPKGQIIGLLGPNGAGKTTLMKMLTGIIVPTSGHVSVMNTIPWKREVTFRKNIGMVMGQKSQLWWDIPALDSFRLLQKFYEIPKEEFDQRIEYLGNLLDVKKLFNIHVKKLSLGERMKMELMASLLHNPKVLFLDEPTIGLDLISQEKLRNFIKEYHQKNPCTVILTSHYMADVEALCSRIVLIFEGEKKYDGEISNFKSILGKNKQVTFYFDKPQDVSNELFKKFDPKWTLENQSVELSIPENTLKETSINILQSFPVIDFNTEKLPIERVMKNIMENPELLNK